MMASQQALVFTCLAVIKEHRNGNITLMQATIQIFSILPGDNFGTEAFGTYIEQLTQTEHECAIAAVWGSTSSVPSSSDPLTVESSYKLLEPAVVTTQDNSDQMPLRMKWTAD